MFSGTMYVLSSRRSPDIVEYVQCVIRDRPLLFAGYSRQHPHASAVFPVRVMVRPHTRLETPSRGLGAAWGGVCAMRLGMDGPGDLQGDEGRGCDDAGAIGWRREGLRVAAYEDARRQLAWIRILARLAGPAGIGSSSALFKLLESPSIVLVALGISVSTPRSRDG